MSDAFISYIPEQGQDDAILKFAVKDISTGLIVQPDGGWQSLSLHRPDGTQVDPADTAVIHAGSLPLPPDYDGAGSVIPEGLDSAPPGRYYLTVNFDAAATLAMAPPYWYIQGTYTHEGEQTVDARWCFRVAAEGQGTIGQTDLDTSCSYCDLDCIRDDSLFTTKDETYVIQASGSVNGDSITFNDNETKAIVKVMVNGAEIFGWQFRKPNELLFFPPLNEGDVVELERDTCMTDEKLLKQACAISRYIDGQLSKVYEVPFPDPVPPLIKDLCMKLTSAEVRMIHFDSTDRDGDRRGAEQWKRWHFKLEELRDEKVGLPADPDDPDHGGGTIPTITGSGIEIDPENLRPVFDLNDIPDPSQIKADTEWRYRRRGI